MKEAWCRLCMEEITNNQTLFEFLNQDALLCDSCRRELEVLNKTVKLNGMPLHIAYTYNDFLENMIFQYKEGLDTALRDVFFHDIIKKINDKFRHFTIVFMPSSEAKTAERGFLPMKEMLHACRMETIEPFYKTQNHKQSLQSFENRKYISQVIKLKPDIVLPKTKLLLVDDVVTSGNTLLCAYDLLQKHTYKIEALALCANPRFVESCDKKDLKRKGMFSIL